MQADYVVTEIPQQIFEVFKTNRGQIVDASAHLPSLGVDAINAGGDRTLATLYGLRAFRADLHQLNYCNIKVKDLVDLNSTDKTKSINSVYLATQHTLFLNLMREGGLNNNVELLDLLNRNDADVWLESETSHWMFKCHDTGFCCRID